MKMVNKLINLMQSLNKNNNANKFRDIYPISRNFGIDRGQPIDRYYIEKFLKKNESDIKGHVLEIGDSLYTKKYGREKVTRSDVLHVISGNPQATIVGDLATGKNISECSFTCMILTQTLLCIYDIHSAITNCYAALKPNGVLLATLPGISQISRYDMERWGDYWRFTDLSVKKIFSDVFGTDNVTIETHGNVFIACAFLQGLATEEVTQDELDYQDPDYQVLITVRAVKK